MWRSFTKSSEIFYVAWCKCLREHFSPACLQIRSVKIRIALPEERCFASIVAGSKRLLILPGTTNTKMILKVLSFTRKMLDNRAQAFQFGLIAINARSSAEHF